MTKTTSNLKQQLVKPHSITVKHVKSKSVKNSIGFQLAKLVKLKRRFVDLQMKNLGLSRTQWQILFWMKILGPCSQKELLINLDIDPAHLTRVLEDFEKKNYIIRAPVKGDRRALFIHMTEYSEQQLVPAIEKTLKKEDSIFFRGFEAQDKRYLHILLQRLETNMEAELNSLQLKRNRNAK